MTLSTIYSRRHIPLFKQTYADPWYCNDSNYEVPPSNERSWHNKNPDKNVGIVCFVDAAFTGSWSQLDALSGFVKTARFLFFMIEKGNEESENVPLSLSKVLPVELMRLRSRLRTSFD